MLYMKSYLIPGNQTINDGTEFPFIKMLCISSVINNNLKIISQRIKIMQTPDLLRNDSLE